MVIQMHSNDIVLSEVQATDTNVAHHRMSKYYQWSLVATGRGTGTQPSTQG